MAIADWTTARRVIHTLKGVAGNIGADALRQACARLETTAEARVPDGEGRAAVQHELARVLNDIASLPAPRQPVAAPSTAAVPDPRQVARVLAELESLIVESSFAAVERLVEERELLERAGLGSEVHAIEAALDDYDFETAQAVIERIAAARSLTDVS